MKKIGLVLGVLTILALFSGVALAGCPEDCDGPYQTCMKICKQTTQAKSPEEAECWNSCLRGVIGCQKRCEEDKRKKDQKSENTGDSTEGYLLVAGYFVAGDTKIVLGASCIEKDLQCTLNGTPCCAPYECKGKFPNTYCQ